MNVSIIYHYIPLIFSFSEPVQEFDKVFYDSNTFMLHIRQAIG